MVNYKSDVNRGDEALAISRQLEPIINDMRADVFKQIQKSNFFQRVDRENCYKMIRAIDLFESKLKKRISNGKMAKEKLKQKG